MANMTELSRQMLKNAFMARNTAEAIAQLRETASFRTLRDILLAADPMHDTEEELKRRIIKGLCTHHPEKKPDSLSHNVGNWFSGRIRTISRDTAFELCLILGLSLEEANHFIMRVTEEAIHWRNPEEIVWGYAIVQKLSYHETLQLIADALEAVKLHGNKTTGSEVYTNLIRGDVLRHLQGSRDELLAYISANAEKWGTFHNTAFELFEKYMQLLQNATPDSDEYEKRRLQHELDIKSGRNTDSKMDESLSIKAILETYFFTKRIQTSGQMDILQRSIRKVWPDEATLSRMKLRKNNTDVSRKVLILLFLATNGDNSDFESRDTPDDVQLTRDKVFRDIYMRLNRMLGRCGFQTLDPRNPFDWMILFCICVEDIWETDRRLTEVLSGLFPDQEENVNEMQ